MMANELRVWVTQGDNNRVMARVVVVQGKTVSVELMNADAAGALFRAANSSAIWNDLGDRAVCDPLAAAVEFERNVAGEIADHIQNARDFHWAKAQGADARVLGLMRANLPQVASVFVLLGDLLGTPVESIKLRPLDAAGEVKSEKGKEAA